MKKNDLMRQTAQKQDERTEYRGQTPISGSKTDPILKCLLVIPPGDLLAASQADRLRTYYRLTPGMVEVISLIPCRAATKWIMSPRRLADIVVSWSVWLKDFIKAVSDCNLVHLFVVKKVAVATYLIPAVVLSRFFDRPLIVSLSAGCRFSESGQGRLRHWLMSKADTITTGSRRMVTELAANGCSSIYIPPVAFPDRSSVKQIEAVQPSMLVVVSGDDYGGAIGAIRAFRLVKQKYPRAELTLAAEKQIISDLAGMVNREKLAGINLCENAEGGRRSKLFVGKDMFLNMADTDSAVDRLILAMLSGLPVVTVPTAVLDSLLDDGVNARFYTAGDYVNLADRIIELIESPELVCRLSVQARASVAGFEWPNVVRHWNRLYQSFRKSGPLND